MLAQEATPEAALRLIRLLEQAQTDVAADQKKLPPPAPKMPPGQAETIRKGVAALPARPGATPGNWPAPTYAGAVTVSSLRRPGLSQALDPEREALDRARQVLEREREACQKEQAACLPDLQGNDPAKRDSAQKQWQAANQRWSAACQQWSEACGHWSEICTQRAQAQIAARAALIRSNADGRLVSGTPANAPPGRK